MKLTIKFLLIVSISFTISFRNGKSANILSVFPFPSKSHDILGSILSKHLSKIGHNVTYISAFKHEEDLNFHLIQIRNMAQLKANMKKYIQGTATKLDVIKQVFKLAEFGGIVLGDKNVQNLINSDSKFDLVIHLIGLDGSIALADRFKAPLIIFVPVSPLHPHNKLLANPSPPSYIPTIVTPTNQDMSFFQRVSNVIIPFIFFNFVEIICNYHGDKAIKTYLKTNVKTDDIRKNVDLILVNSDVSTESPRPYVPNMIQIGGFHLQKPEKLNEDIKQVLDDAKNGFVYVSFGTNVILKDLPQRFLDTLKNSLKKLPFKIVMKYEDDFMMDKPENFYLKKWFQQPSVLAHPNIKLFITHGGYGGIAESLYYGIPLICIPIFADQWKNCIDAEYNGYGIVIDWKEVNEEILSNSLNLVLWNETIKKSVMFKSDLYRNQPMNPMDKAVYWIEHIIKYKNGKHLKVKGTDLVWYQYYLIDVFLFLGFVSILILFGLFYLFRLCKILYKRFNKVKMN